MKAFSAPQIMIGVIMASGAGLKAQGTRKLKAESKNRGQGQGPGEEQERHKAHGFRHKAARDR